MFLAPIMDDINRIVVPRINAEWEKVAYALRYDIHTVKSIKCKCKGPKECCMELFSDWLSTSNGVKPKIWLTLLDTLKSIGDLTAARDEILKEVEEMHKQQK